MKIGEATKSNSFNGFTLIEVIVSLAILGVIMGGVILGYVQANRMAEWSSMSLAAQSYAMEGAEQARAADWRPRDWPPTNGPGTMDELPATNYTTVDIMDIPMKGTPSASDFSSWVTNNISITDVSANPPLRQIRSDCIWMFTPSGQLQTNTVILMRAPDQ